MKTYNVRKNFCITKIILATNLQIGISKESKFQHMALIIFVNNKIVVVLH